MYRGRDNNANTDRWGEIGNVASQLDGYNDNVYCAVIGTKSL